MGTKEKRTETIQIRVRPSDLEHWKQAAQAADQPLSSWLTNSANKVILRSTPITIEGVEARRIISFPDYAVTREGKVFQNVEDEWLEIAPKKQADGYFYVNIHGKTKALHRWVIEEFAGPPEEGQVCRHLDGDKTNNQVDNLCWGTQAENAKDSAEHQKLREQGEIPPLEPVQHNLITLRASDFSLEAYERAAKAARMSRHAWMRTVLNITAGISELPAQLSRAIAAAKAAEQAAEQAAKEKPIKDGKW